MIRSRIETGLWALSAVSLAVAAGSSIAAETNASKYRALMQSESYLHGEVLQHASYDLIRANRDLTYIPSHKGPLGITLSEPECPDLNSARQDMELARQKVVDTDPQFAQAIIEIEKTIPSITMPSINCPFQNGQIYDVYLASRDKLNALSAGLEAASIPYTAELRSHNGDNMPMINLIVGGIGGAAMFGTLAYDRKDRRRGLSSSIQRRTQTTKSK